MIDKKGIVRHQVVNDLPLGRNVDEAIRMLDALNFVEEHGEVCPANWKKGGRGDEADRRRRRQVPQETRRSDLGKG